MVVTAAVSAQQPVYRETVDVSRLLIDVRVLDREGRAFVDLGPEDFAVKIDGKNARVESVQWIGGHPDTLGAREYRSGLDPSPRGRLIVFLVQRDMERGRMTGLMRAMTEAPAFLQAFTLEDRIAVLSFDHHLKVWLDFTRDIDAVRRVLQRDVIVTRPGAVNQADGVSLVARLEPGRAFRTHRIEDALTVIAEALAPLPGSKSVVLVGYGFGRLTGGRGSMSVLLDGSYDRARAALQGARATVFCLDVTDADFHSLEVGLQAVADDTGGFFARTHIFTKDAFGRVAAALQGHYVLFVDKPTLSGGTHRLDVKLRDREGTIYVKSGFSDGR